ARTASAEALAGPPRAPRRLTPRAVRRRQSRRYGENVTESVASTTMSAGFTVPSASDPGTVRARKTVYVPAGSDGQTKWKRFGSAVVGSPAGTVTPVAYAGKPVAEPDRHRTVNADDPWVTKASASPCGQPKLGAEVA